MLITQTTAVLVNAVVAALYWLDWLQIWHILAASLAMGSSYTLNMPSRQSLMAEIVPRRLLHNATALHTASMNLSRITGPGLAGLLMSLTGPLAVLLTNLVANAWTVAQLLSVRYRPSRPSRPFRLRGGELSEGFRYAWRSRELSEVLVIASLANLFGLSFVQLLPSLARDALRVGPDGLGLLTSAMGGGALTGSLLLARRGAVPRKDLVLWVAALVVGLLLFVLGRVDHLPVAAALLAVIGATNATITSLGLASVQERVPDELSGRVFGVYMLTMALMPLGALPLGTLAAQLGTAPAISLWGLLGALSLSALLATRLLPARRMRSERVVPS
jgi:MFS family permease